MKNVSNNFKEELHNGNRKYVKSCDITLVDGTVLNITEKNTWQNGFLLDSAVTNDGSFDIGSAMSDQFVLTLNNIYDEYSAYDFAKAQVSNVKVGLRLSNSNYEYVKQGMFVVDEPQYNGSTIRLECYDNMVKFDKDYSLSNLAFPATLNSIVIDACECCGVSMAASMTNLRNSSYVVDDKPVADNLTFRQVLVWVAEICGVWFKCDENGALSYKAIDALIANELYDNMQINSDKCHHIVSTMGIELSTDDVVITGIEVVEKGEETHTSYFEGTKDYFLSIQDNELIQNGKGQTVVSYLGELFNGLRFRPMQLKCLTDPTIEVGDYSFVTDRKGVSYFTILTQVSFAPGEFQSVSCEAESPERNSASRYYQDTRTYQELRQSIQKYKTVFEKEIEKLSQIIGQSEGAYTTVKTVDGGGSIFYLHNKPSLDDSDMIWKMTAEAWSVTTDGGETWNAGMTVDGVVIAKILNTIGVNADWINTGALVVKDEKGNVVFSADMKTGKVIISGNSVMIGDVALDEELKGIKNDIQQSVSITMYLNNEYQGIPVNTDGEYEVFPEDVKTIVTVMQGSTDITDQCFYSIATSNAVTGEWDDTEKSYTVTSLSADKGWVDITASYLSTFSITKRFTVAKIKSGDDGRTYVLEQSTNILKRTADGTLAPNYIEYSSFYRDGQSTKREPYAGIFLIEESSDGNVWTQLYESAEAESYVRHELYSVLSNGEGEIIANEDGDAIGIARDSVSIRCTLYTSDKTEVVDHQTAVLVTDVNALTHEEIFNLLTNNGEVKGIYKEGDQLYISFTYAKGGELTLGGTNNGNGRLKILDSSGKQVGYIDNTGVHFNQGSFEGTITSGSGNIAGWTITKDSINSINNLIKLLSSGAIVLDDNGYLQIGNTKLTNRSHALKVDGGLWIYNGIEEFSDGTDHMRIYNLKHVTSGGHLVFGSDGATVCYAASSSKRYKDFERLLTNEDVKRAFDVDVVWAKYKEDYNLDKSDPFYGKYMPMFFAEDIEEKIPSAAVYKNGQIEDWNHRVMIPVMFQMIKNQKQEIELLQKQIRTIKEVS